MESSSVSDRILNLCLEPININSVFVAFKVSLLDKRDHVYLRHLSTEYRSILSADMSTDSRPICRPTVGQYIDRYSADMSAETRSIYRPTVGRHACRATPSDTSPPLGRHSADTLTTLGQHYAHLVSSCY